MSKRILITVLIMTFLIVAGQSIAQEKEKAKTEGPHFFNTMTGKSVGKVLCEKKITIDTAIPAIPGAHVHFSNSFIEILQNAQAAMLGNEEKILTVSVQREDKSIVVIIGDNGCGMDEHTRRKALDMLEHPPESAEAPMSGLPSVAYMLQSYNPRYRIESSPGNTMLRIDFPVPELTD